MSKSYKDFAKQLNEGKGGYPPKMHNNPRYIEPGSSYAGHDLQLYKKIDTIARKHGGFLWAPLPEDEMIIIVYGKEEEADVKMLRLRKELEKIHVYPSDDADGIYNKQYGFLELAVN